MTKKYELSKTVFENVIKGLINMETEKKQLLEDYFSKSSKERDEFKNLLDNYIKQVDYIIRNSSVAEETDNNLPFVIIDSIVEVEDMESGDIYNFKIVPPFFDTGSNCVSYFSPTGKALLLKKVGENVSIKAPGGEFKYKIRSITL